jgi:class 3 adenylate cyclase/pimeloyl-ACP methyl ester carboxylesterase/DNA-binding winged helix-turn-helix (wHTH) protein
MIYRFEDFELDTRLFELRRAGTPVPLERQVFDLLSFLVQNRERLVLKEELLDRVWGDRFVGESALNSRIMTARKALGDSGREQRLIRTVHGRGYRFAGAVEEQQPQGENPPRPRGNIAEAPFDTPFEAREQQIRFCTAADGVRLAYAVVGDGPPLVKAPNWLSHLEFEWRSPVWRHWIEELSHDHTYVRYDQRGSGLSDWDCEDLSWEAWVTDLETVADALGLERFPLIGISQGGAVAIAYAVRNPERVSHLILYGAYARGWRRRMSQDHVEEEEAVITLMRNGWGRDNPAYRQIFASSFIPAATWEQMRWFNDLCRISASPENAVRFRRTSGDADVTDLLPQVKAPTLVLHARGDLRVSFDQGRVLAAGIPGSRFVPLDTSNHILLEGEPAWTRFLEEVRAFLGVSSPGPAASLGITKTILFTDIEGSTELTQELGDEPAREILRKHEEIVRSSLAAHGGTEIKVMGDGFMASFPSATRAIECAIAIQRAQEQTAEKYPLKVRMGLNAGEPVAEGGDLFGSSVNLAARVASSARGGEILISDVVRQLVAGKGFVLADRGSAALRGFAEPVTLYEVIWRQ